MTISHRASSTRELCAQVTGLQYSLPFLVAQGMLLLRFTGLNRLIKGIIVGLFVTQLAACATPTSNLINIAEAEHFEQVRKRSEGYELLVLHNAKAGRKTNQLHIYLEGDGTPWVYRVIRTRDPTPRQPLMLQLMAQDSAAAAYVGRPCYNGSYADDGCSSELWTSARYSEKIVASMSGVIRQLIESTGAQSVRLFGHSGGGTLAMLIAERIQQVSHVVTLAGNLDIEGWVAHHRYTPLFGSLNPATQPPLRLGVKQWHFLGGDDSVIPVSLVKPFVNAQPNSFGFEIGNYTHGCCWRRMWSKALAALDSGNTQALPGIRFKFPR